jgi:hypothetical protein
MNEPTPVILHSSSEWDGQVLKTNNVTGYVVNFLDNLQALLSSPSFKAEVTDIHRSNDGLMRDICDGSFFSNHPLFQRFPSALQVVIYYDDVEVYNALGSSAGDYKLGAFYYSLYNISPAFRSVLQSIQLLAVAKANDIHDYGCETLLRPFIEDMKRLGQDDGYEVVVNGQQITLHGAVVCVCGDTPASNFIGGFKEGVGFSLRRCRACMATGESMSKHFNINDFESRDKVSHSHFCDLIESDVTGRGNFSVTYGINKRSILCELPYFDVTQCIPYDIMHTLFEGVVPHYLNELFKHLIDDDVVSLQYINQSLGLICGDGSTSKPATIFREGGNGTRFIFRQKASQMESIIRFLPLSIGADIPEDDRHWECLMILWDICNISLAFEVTPEDAGHMSWLAELFLESFSTLYPSKFLYLYC